MPRKPLHERHTVGVFRDRESATEAAKEAKRQGVPPDHVRLDAPEDEVTSLRGEMKEEIDETMVGPGVGPITKEARRRIAWLVPACAVVGAAVLLPLAFLPIRLDLAVRLVIAAIVGAVAGSVTGLVLGGGLGMKDPRSRDSRLAAERGVTVGVDARDTDQAKDVVEGMEDRRPIRTDLTTSEHDPTDRATRSKDGRKAG